jgi:hypothetical protein
MERSMKKKGKKMTNSSVEKIDTSGKRESIVKNS